jgi:hypothetical protein
LAKKFDVHRDALWRHMKNHVSADARASFLVGVASLERLREKAIEEKGSVLEHLQIARSMTLNAMVASAGAASWTTFAMLVGRYAELNRDVARVSGEALQLPGVSITNNFLAIMSSPQMAELQSGLLAITRANPEVRGEIVQLLRRIDAGSGPQGNAAAPRAIECEAIEAG